MKGPTSMVNNVEPKAPFNAKLMPTNEAKANGGLGAMLNAIKHPNRPAKTTSRGPLSV